MLQLVCPACSAQAHIVILHRQVGTTRLAAPTRLHTACRYGEVVLVGYRERHRARQGDIVVDVVRPDL